MWPVRESANTASNDPSCDLPYATGESEMKVFFSCVRVFATPRTVTCQAPLSMGFARLFCPWDLPGKNTGVGCHALLQGLSTQGTNLGLLQCRQILYHLSHQGNHLFNLFLPQSIVAVSILWNISLFGVNFLKIASPA